MSEQSPSWRHKWSNVTPSSSVSSSILCMGIVPDRERGMEAVSKDEPLGKSSSLVASVALVA